jgi:transposase, IS30 family
MPGKALCAEEREEIRAGIERGESFRAIGRLLDRSGSTISREVERNTVTSRYNAVTAQRLTNRRRHRPKPLKLSLDKLLGAAVRRELVAGYSPAAVAVRLQHKVCTETIYKAVYRRVLDGLTARQCLHTRRSRRKRHVQPDQRNPRTTWHKHAPNVSQRPVTANDRNEPGHWEGDLIIGQRGGSAVVTLVERTSRLVILLAVGFNRGTIHISELIVAMLKGLPASMKRSLTWDQGSEMAHWRKIQDQTGVPIYLCNPASPWQRGTNENTNRLIRFWLPKGTNLNTHTQNDLNKIAELINTHPRRIHDWQTANQVYNQLVH